MKKQYVLVSLLIIIFTSSLNAEVYEDAEDGDTSGWRIYDDSPSGATISNEVDNGTSAIKLSGAARSNGYALGWVSGNDAWNNTEEKNIRWSMKYNESYVVYVSVMTEEGHRYLQYSNSNSDNGLNSNGRDIHHGLGSDTTDGTWYEFNRDLEADLAEFESDNSILSVDAFLIRGSGLVDNIRLSTFRNPMPYYTFEEVETEPILLDSQLELYKFDGDNKVHVKTTHQFDTASIHLPRVNHVTINNILYFLVNYHFDGADEGVDLWKSDGTAAGTVPIKTSIDSFRRDSRIINYIDGKLYFRVSVFIGYAPDPPFAPEVIYQLWESDGTEAGTVVVDEE